MNNKKTISILMLFAFVFTTSYAINEASATSPDYHGHKWFWEETDYRYGTLNGLNGLTEAEVESGIDAARVELNSASEYHADSVTTGNYWILQAYNSNSSVLGWQVPDHDYFNYLSDSDIWFNTNSNIDWVDGNTSTDTNIRAVALHELFHGVDMDHVAGSNSAMYEYYYYSSWEALSTDDNTQMVTIYGT